MKTELAIGGSSSNPFFFSKAKRRIIMTAENILLIIAAWLIAVGSIIIPTKVIKKKAIPTKTTLGDVVTGINSLKDTIYAAMGIEIGIIVTVMVIVNR